MTDYQKPHSNPQYAGIPEWAVYFAMDSTFDPREVWPAIQAFGEEKAILAYGEDRLTLGRKDRGQGKVAVGVLTNCPRCKRPFDAAQGPPSKGDTIVPGWYADHIGAKLEAIEAKLDFIGDTLTKDYNKRFGPKAE